MSRLDKIEELLASPSQHSAEHGYTTLTEESQCWRCGVWLAVEDRALELGACNRCVEDLRNPAPAAEEWLPISPADRAHDAVMRVYAHRLDPVQAASVEVGRRLMARMMEGLRDALVQYSSRMRDDMLAIGRAFDFTEEELRTTCGMSTDLIGAYPDAIDEPDVDGVQLARPIANCEHVSAEDGTCDHPNAMTPECWLTPGGERCDCPPLDLRERIVEQLRDANPVPAIRTGYLRGSIDVPPLTFWRNDWSNQWARDPVPCVMHNEDECYPGGIPCRDCPRRAHR